MPAPSEAYEVSVTDVYPAIAPENFKGSHTGKVVFITGGGTGLGFASAQAFVQAGAKVFIAGRRVAPLEAAKVKLEALGGEVGFCAVDVVDEASVKEGVAAAIRQFGRIDIVIANAGSTSSAGTTIKDTNASEWWQSIEVNLRGAFITAHATLPELVKTGNGYIFFLSSSLAQARKSGDSAYNISKHALNRLAEWVDLENSKDGVKSIAIHPGAVPTDLSLEYRTSHNISAHVFSHNAALSAWTEVKLSSGSEDWLSGRFFDVTWDITKINELKEKIIEQDALKNRLALPL